MNVVGYMNTTTYNPETKIASIQPGSNWGQVYKTLDEYGVTTVGARGDVVGVGGFTTGGGVSQVLQKSPQLYPWPLPTIHSTHSTLTPAALPATPSLTSRSFSPTAESPMRMRTIIPTCGSRLRGDLEILGLSLVLISVCISSPCLLCKLTHCLHS